LAELERMLMRYKTQVNLVVWTILGLSTIGTAPKMVSRLAHSSSEELKALGIKALIWYVGLFLLNRFFRSPSSRDMSPDEEDAEYANSVIGISLVLQLVCAACFVHLLFLNLQRLRTGNGWYHLDGYLCGFCVLVILALFPARWHARRYLLTYRPGEEMLAVILLFTSIGVFVAAPVALFSFVLLIGSLETGHGWDSGLAGVSLGAGIIYLVTQPCRRWAKVRYDSLESVTVKPSTGSP
jgi:hypothetical protein